MHDAGNGDVHGQVGGWEDTCAHPVVARIQRTMHDDFAAKFHFLAVAGLGADVQGVVDAVDGAVGCTGKVSWYEV